MVAPSDPASDPSAAAPGSLERVRRFANSLDRYRGRDELATVGPARRLVRSLLDIGDRVSIDEEALAEIRLARATIRWTLGCTGLWSLDDQDSTADAPPGWVASPRLIAGAGGLEVEGQGLHVSLSSMTLDLFVAQHTGTILRLKPCANPSCQWVFWDASRPGSGRWCSMRLCGGQSKSRRFRARHAGDSTQ